MFRRGFRRGMIRQLAQPNVPPLLRRAHELMASGNYVAAAKAFEQLAHAGEARQHPKTAQMYLQAGRARILAGQKPAGFAHLKHGLGLLKDKPGRLFHMGNRVVTELNEHGMTAEAQEIASWLKTALPSMPASARMGATAPAKKPVLPTHCPGSGGPVRVDDLEWLDDLTADCNWCGSPVRANG